MKNALNRMALRQRFGRGLAGLTVGALTVGTALAQSDSGNAGADKIIDEVNGLVTVAAAVVGAAVLVVIVPWGAKLAIRAFKSIN